MTNESASAATLSRPRVLSGMAILLFLAIGLLLVSSMPLGAQSNGPIEFPENGDGVVAVFTAEDPEQKSVTWTILPVADAPVDADGDGTDDFDANDAADAALFSISSSGELTFVSAPDYENPQGGTANTSNTYELVIRASDGSVMGYHKVEVEVTNEDETATTGIELTSLQPEVSREITVAYVDGVGNPYVNAAGVANAAIVDPDGNEAGTAPDPNASPPETTEANPTVNTIPDADVSWQWSSSSTRDGTFTDIDGDAAKAVTYTPGSGDNGMFLRITGTYEDAQGEGKTVEATSMYPVRAFPSGNSAPAFPADFDTTTPTTLDAPTAEADDNATAGDEIGDPIEANDANTDDNLTYSLEAMTGGTATDADVFQIDRKTGQVSVGLGKTLHPETDTGETASSSVVIEDSDGFTVTIRATDPSGLSVTVDLTITVGDTDEAPVFTAAKTSRSHAENEPITTLVEAAFAAYDPEAAGALPRTGYSLSGADASKFSITAGGAGELTFLASPNFESPTDANRDNVYEVTVKASDASTPANSTSVDVTVTVTNVEEDGTITLNASQPRIGVPIRVTSLTDIDRGITGVTYQWERSSEGTSASPATCTDPTAPTFGEIDGATSTAYTPVSADDGKCLQVTASYTDNNGSDEVSAVPASPVQKVRNLAPAFEDEVATEVGIQIMPRRVNENAAAGTAVTLGSTPNTTNDPVNATDDADDATNDGPILYLLSGADAAPFDISSVAGSEGQITVKTGATLNHETKDTYTVTVTARDAEGLSSSVRVTINIIDENEPPEISGPSSEMHAENDAGTVATFTANDPENKSVTWSVETDDTVSTDLATTDVTDSGLFDISSSGALTFKTAPNYEDPTIGGTRSDGTNTYNLVVAASDGTVTGYQKVTVEVTNEDETATTGIELSSLQPQVSTEITVAYVDSLGNPYVGPDGIVNGNTDTSVGAVDAGGIVDPDGSKADTAVTTIPFADVSWQWSKSSSRNGTYTPIPGDSAKVDTYEPASADFGMFLRVTGTYEDGESDGKTVVATSMYPVRAFPSGNSAPVFPPDFDTTTPTTLDAPTAEADDNATAGDNVGDPVVAPDANNDNLTYSIEAMTGGTATDADVFQIDRKTGQVSVGLGKTLHPETDGGETGSSSVVVEDSDGFVVTIRATDPSGLSDTVDLTITVGDTDEAPVFTAGGTSHSHAENEPIFTVVETFVAYDPETSGNLPSTGYTLSGADASKFSITAGGAGELTFLASPNFESPTDANKDNVYEVTVRASDTSTPAKSTSVDVTVTVTNVEEDGAVMLSASQPRIGVPIQVTSVTDIDGGVTGVTYQWEKSSEGTATTAADCSAGNIANLTFGEIDGATMAAYTPVSADDGNCLRVTASYTDNKGSDDASTVPTSAVQKVRNLAPAFEDEVATEMGIQIMPRRVAENSPASTNVTLGATASATDDPVNATDDTDEATNDGPIVYLLSGPDAAPFDIDGTGQITVKAGAMLDRETKDTYPVTVTARDAEGLESSVQVTIMITDVNEAPVITLGGLAISGDRSVEVAENSTTVATYTARGPNAAMATWDLSGDDAALFDISSGGELTFNREPDFESPGSDAGTNEYSVTVEADDGTYEATYDVTVTVTDVEEMTPTPGTLQERYDADDSGAIEKSEMITAINDYLFGTGTDAISKADMIDVINLYLFG